MSFASPYTLVGSGVPKSVKVLFSQRAGWLPEEVQTQPTIWPASLMAVARLLSSPGSVPRSWIGSVADAEGATTNTPRSNARLATRTSAATILPMRTRTVPTPCTLEIPLDPPSTGFSLHRYSGMEVSHDKLTLRLYAP